MFSLLCRNDAILFIIYLLLCASNAFAAHTYLEDANSTQPPSGNSNTASLESHNWPRVMMAETQDFSGDIELYSKYDIIATQAGSIRKVANLLQSYPSILYFRMFNPQEYLGYNDEDTGIFCPQSHGNPFENTSNMTDACNVYAGHWLYQAGSTTLNNINASQTTVRVSDPTRFQTGEYAVIYNAPAGSFNNAEHVRIIAKSGDTLTISRAYKSTAAAHNQGSIIAQHVKGNGASNDPRNWVYNFSTDGPRDGNNRRYIDFLPIWMSQNISKDHKGNSVNIAISGILFDTDFHFLFKSKKADVNNDLITDDGISPNGNNWWGNGFELFYNKVRSRFPDMIISGGTRDARGFDSLNGTQVEGYPSYSDFQSATPDYERLGSLLSRYTTHMRARDTGPAHSHVLSKTPSQLYPFGTTPRPSNNKTFRFALGMTLLEDGYFGFRNTVEHTDVWFDEYAVDVTPNSATYGQAIASNPSNESQIRAHRGWLGKPISLRQRVYDDATFSPNQSLIDNGTFDVNLQNWTGRNVSLARDTNTTNTQDGLGALRISNHQGGFRRNFSDASAKGPRVNVLSGTSYTLAFSAKASEIREISVSMGDHSERFMLTPNWQRFVMTFKAEQSSNIPVKFNVGREDSVVWLDSIYAFAADANLFRRDFENGIVIVNATPDTQTFDLGSSFQKILGTQDPINNGETISQVSLNAYDALLLVNSQNSQTQPSTALSVADKFVNEGSGTTYVKVSTNQITNDSITFSYRTLPDSASDQTGDYELTQGQKTIKAGRDSTFIPINITDDTDYEGNEKFLFRLLDVVNGNALINKNTGVINIIENDPKSSALPIVSIKGTYVNEASATTYVEIYTPDSTNEDITVSYQTNPNTAQINDFVEKQGQATIRAGRNNVFVPINIQNDTLVEGQEVFYVTLGNVLSNNAVIINAQAEVIIVDDDQ